jgi:hypothetical protein
MIAGDLGDGLSPRRPKSTPAGRAVPAHGPAPAPNQDGGQGRFMSRQKRPRVSASTGTAAAGSLTHSGRSDQSLLSGETAFRPGKSSSQPPDASHRSLTSKPTEQSQYFGCMCHSRSWPLYAVRVGLGEVQQRYVWRRGLGSDPAPPAIRRRRLSCICLLCVGRRRVALARGLQGRRAPGTTASQTIADA